MSHSTPNRLTPREAAARLSVADVTVRKWVRDFDLGEKRGFRVQVDTQKLLAFLRDRYPELLTANGELPDYEDPTQDQPTGA